MTAPGIYNPAQAEAHARRVARDEDDAEAREVEVMANAIKMAFVWETGGFGEQDDAKIAMLCATAARNALLAMREGGE